MDSIIKTVLDSNWEELTTYTEDRARQKILSRIDTKKQEIVDMLNTGMSTSVEDAE